MTVSRRRFRQALRRVVASALEPRGYRLIDEPEGYKGVVGGVYMMFFQKRLWEDTYGSIGFRVLPLYMEPQEAKLWRQAFGVVMYRHRGTVPQPPDFEGNNIDVSLAYLMWTILDVKVYGSGHHEWGFSTEEELEDALQDAVENLVAYGLPWLEDPSTQDPHPRGEELEQLRRQTLQRFREQGIRVFGDEGESDPE